MPALFCFRAVTVFNFFLSPASLAATSLDFFVYQVLSMAPRNLRTSTHSFDANISQSQATPATTAFSSPSLVNQSNTASMQDILFGVLAIILAAASVLLAYLQLVHMRNQARSHRPDTEMLSIRKHAFCMPVYLSG